MLLNCGLTHAFTNAALDSLRSAELSDRPVAATRRKSSQRSRQRALNKRVGSARDCQQSVPGATPRGHLASKLSTSGQAWSRYQAVQPLEHMPLYDVLTQQPAWPVALPSIARPRSTVLAPVTSIAATSASDYGGIGDKAESPFAAPSSPAVVTPENQAWSSTTSPDQGEPIPSPPWRARRRSAPEVPFLTFLEEASTPTAAPDSSKLLAQGLRSFFKNPGPRYDSTTPRSGSASGRGSVATNTSEARRRASKDDGYQANLSASMSFPLKSVTPRSTSHGTPCRVSPSSRGSMLKGPQTPATATSATTTIPLCAPTPPSKGPVPQRVQRLQTRRLEKAKTDKALRADNEDPELSDRQRRFGALPKEQQEAAHRAFEYFDVDSSGYLDQDEISRCLREFGLQGTTTAEKREIINTARQAAKCAEGEPLAIDVVSFALDVIPAVRSRLGDLQYLQLVTKFQTADTSGAEMLSVQQCREMSQKLGLDHNMMQKVMEETLSKNGDEDVTFGDLQEMLVRTREMVGRLVAQRERMIQEENCLDDDTFMEYRQDLIPLHECFSRYVLNDARSISFKQCEQVLVEFGLLPKNPSERRVLVNQLKEGGIVTHHKLTFRDVLDTVGVVRMVHQQNRLANHRQMFDRFDKNRNGLLGLDELAQFLTAIGCCPRNRTEQEEIGRVIQAADVDGNGALDFDEFQVLIQRMDERLKSMRYDQELRYAQSLNFSDEQVQEFRWVFDSLDLDNSGKLDLAEIKKCLALMRKKVPNEVLERNLRQLDADGNGELDFREFLDFMRLLRDGEGVFAEEVQLFPNRPSELEVRTMKRTLECFTLSKTYLATLNREELLELFCSLFEIGKDDDLYQKLNVKNTGELFEEARKRSNLLQPS